MYYTNINFFVSLSMPPLENGYIQYVHATSVGL